MFSRRTQKSAEYDRFRCHTRWGGNLHRKRLLFTKFATPHTNIQQFWALYNKPLRDCTLSAAHYLAFEELPYLCLHSLASYRPIQRGYCTPSSFLPFHHKNPGRSLSEVCGREKHVKQIFSRVLGYTRPLRLRRTASTSAVINPISTRAMAT